MLYREDVHSSRATFVLDSSPFTLQIIYSEYFFTRKLLILDFSLILTCLKEIKCTLIKCIILYEFVCLKVLGSNGEIRVEIEINTPYKTH